MSEVGLFVQCGTYEEAVNWMSRMMSVDFHPVFTFQYVFENQHKDFLAKGEGSSAFGVVTDVLDEHVCSVCYFLEVGYVFFRIDSATLVETASLIMRYLSDEWHFVVIAPNYQDWVDLQMLVGGKAYLCVAPFLGEDIELWNSTNVLGYIATKDIFTSKRAVEEEYAKLLQKYTRDKVIVFDKFTMRETACRALTTLIKKSLVDGDEDVYNPLVTITGEMQKSAYENMERDTLKYDLYAKAIKLALQAKPDAVMAFLGAGRGPNVTAAIKLGAKKIFVLDKNKGVCELLKRKKRSQWPDFVEVFDGDMRDLELPAKVDILVTELLGSFGDNELDPECLQFCDRFLSPQGISIPCYYESMLEPISSEGLWTKCREEASAEDMQLAGMVRQISLSEPQQCFEYRHPGQNTLYQRKVLVFDIKKDGLLHGFCGWFRFVLYGDLEMSNPPESNNQSWFPSFFPIITPFYVKAGQKLRLCFERKGNDKAVWYEWCVTEPVCTKIHNAAGSAFSFSLR